MLNSKKKCNFAALFVFSAKTLSIKTQKTHTKHTMVHLTNTLRSATFLLGTAILMAFLFCAPMHAQTPTFKSTSSYKIANPNYSSQQIDPTTIGHQTYRSTIYTPFGSGTPSSNNPSGNSGSGGSGDPDDDVGIPGWADTPSEPLPIGDTAPLFLFAAAMIAIIATRQRKQKQLTTQTQSTNNNNNPTQHMTTRKQTYQSLRQKLFLLLVFVCIAGNTFAWKPIMIGHRGSRSGVENTKEAFINGIKNHGFKALECDVKVTADKKYICWHDDNIANSIISNRNYDVSIHTNNLAGLQDLALAQSRTNTITGIKTSYTGVICTLQEFLQICKDYNVTPIVEIKYNLLNIKSDGTNFSGLSDIYNIIANLDMLDKTVVLGTETMMEYYKNNHPNIQRMWLTNSITDAHITRCQELGCWIDSQPYLYYDSEKPANNKAITAAQIKKCQDAGVKVGLWTLNGTSSYNTYGAMRPNFITSDDNVVKDLPDLTGTDPNAPTTDKTIYFRPSTTNFTKGYTNRTTKGKDAGWDYVYWAKNGRLTASVHGNLKGSIFLDYGQTKNNADLKDSPTSRFIPITVPTGYTGVIAYRIGSMTESVYINWKNSSGAKGVTEVENTDISNTIPKFTNTVTEIPAPEPIPTDGKNLLCNREGWWDVWYWAYYLPTTNTVTMYFANTSDWTDVKLVTGKDIYTHETAPTKTISNTKLAFFNLNGKEFGYEKYGFSGNGTTWDNSKTIPVVGGSESNWVYDESSSHANNKTDAAKNSNANQNRIANRIKYANNRTGLLEDLLSGANLFIPGAANDAAVSKQTLGSWQDLNHKQTIIVGTGGKLNYQTTKLTGEGAHDTYSASDQTGTVTFTAAYTATTILRAKPNDGYVFLGFYDENGKYIERGTTDEYPGFIYRYEAPNAPKTIEARFTAQANIISKKVRMQLWSDSNKDYLDWTSTPSGNSFTINYTDVTTGTEQEYTFNKPLSENFSAWICKDKNYIQFNNIDPKKSITLTANTGTNYTFVGWWNNNSGQFLDNPWEIPSNNDLGVTARIAPADKIKQQTIKIEGEGQVNIRYFFSHSNDNVRESTFDQNSSFNAWAGSEVTLTAAPLAGYKFDGWYEGGNKITTGVDGNTLTYTADDTHTITAKFKQKVHKLSVSVLNYNPEYDKFEEYGYEYNTVTLTQGGTKLKESYSSFEHTFNEETTVTLTATPEEGEDGYDFVGWYINDEKLTKDGSNSLYTLASDDSKVLTINLSGEVAVNARFAPKKCWEVIIRNNIGGLYTVQYSRDENFTTYQTAESALDHYTYTHFAFGTTYVRVSPQPILGYKLLNFKVGGSTAIAGNTIKYGPTYDPEKHTTKKSQVVTNFVREDDQIVYLNLRGSGGNIHAEWATNDPNQHAYYAFVDNSFYSAKGQLQLKWIKMTHVQDYCYTCTIPGNMYNRISFVQIGKDSEGNFITNGRNDLPITTVNINFDTISQLSLNYVRDTLHLEKRRTSLTAIPATRNNCYRLNWSWNSSTQTNDHGWTEPPTQAGDFRLVYIEQTVVDKNTIREDYHFEDAGLIKQAADSEDIISLHIYNKVSDGVNGVNNPEIILQKCTAIVDSKSQWADVERYMVFGPLRSNNAGVIKMPNRKNTASETIVVDKGIAPIVAAASKEDKACGVWNFVIVQDNAGGAKIAVDRTSRYEDNIYYIRTTNATGQYNNYTHPDNIMSTSEYAKNHSNYSHYFIRYVDIYEDGTPTAEAGKHPLVKFAIANKHSVYLNNELMINNDRFTSGICKDEYEDDPSVVNKGGAPNLPSDATVRFGWDIKTNRLTRAYIANTTIKNNDYLVVDGTSSIGSPQGDDKYFTDNSNWLYSIDLPDAKAGAKAKVKAKMNGQYQYFMGSGAQDGYETLISGNGANTYPIRLLYDFKDDRFTTIYHPESGTINNDVELSTPLMIERVHNDKATQIQLETNKKITTVQAGEDQYTQPAYAVMTFRESVLADASKTHHEKMFYWISFPFDVRIKDVFGLGDYGKYWIMEEYNGKQRAASGLAQNNWKYITKKSHILKKDTGYVLCLNYSQILQDQLFKSYGGSDKTLNSGKLSLYFPSYNMISSADITGGQTREVTLEQYENANTAWNHHNWHIIGVPSFADPKFVDLQDDIPFVYEYWHPSDAYAAVSINDVEFQAMHAYMVQYHGKINWESVVNTGDGSVTPSKLAAKTDEDADKKIMLRLELQQAGSTIDKTYVQLRDDKGTKGFDMSLDLTKIINAGANIYSIVDNHEMAGNAIPKEETVLPLGVVITAAGEYTFAMPNGTEGMIVELIDYEQGTCTNLLVGDYTVNMPEGTNNTRFALRLKPDKVATSVEDITSGTNDNNVRKLLIDGVLYLQQGNNTYDAQGHAIR